jgi:hypothetical protein
MPKRGVVRSVCLYNLIDDELKKYIKIKPKRKKCLEDILRIFQNTMWR